jgi:predicted permease
MSSAVAILLLAIGIGGNTTVYTVVDRVLLEPPPMVQSPDELVGLGWTMTSQADVVFGYYDYEYYREQGEAFAAMLAYGGFPGARGRRTDGGGGEVVVGLGEVTEQAGAWVVSGNYFQVLGVPMGLGAGFSPDVQKGEPGVAEVVLSHGFWQRSLGGDPTAQDRPLYLNGVPFRIAGVTPGEFKGVNPGEPLPDLFVPILSAEVISPGYSSQLRRYGEDGSPNASRFLRLIARLEPGYDLAAAQSAATVLQARWVEEFSDWSQTMYGETHQLQLRSRFNLAPFEARALQRQLFFLWFVMGAVFLIGCANLALLLLANAAGRAREMGIRASLGAGRSRLLGQLITESLVLAALGGAAGLCLTFVGSGAIAATLPLTLEAGFAPDASVVMFALLLATLAAVLFGTAPAWALARTDAVTLVQRPGQERTRALFRGGLVVTQTALSILLLIGGGLLARSVQAVQQVDLGWDPDRRLILGVQLDNGGYSDAEGFSFVRGALDRLARVPGVRSATVCNRVPFLGSNTLAFTAPGTDFSEQGLRTGVNLVGPAYFETMDIPILAGRAFSGDDAVGGPLVAVVNETFAQRMWPEEDPLGKSLDFFGESMAVVGLAKTSVYYNVTEQPRSHVYIPSLQFYQGMQNFIVATDPPTGTMVGRVEEALRELDPNLGISPTPLESLVSEQRSTFRVWTALIATFAGIALFLALVGLYGVQSYLVSRRTREIGIRMALGAKAGSVVRGVVRTGLALGALGAVIGVLAALALSGLIQGLLFGVAPNDGLIFSVVPALLLAACAAASLVPAVRASTISPAEALSSE